MPGFDPYAYATHEDPYPAYRWLRDEAPAYWNEEIGFWAISRHDDVRDALRDWTTYSSAGGITIERGAGGMGPMLLEMDPPRHTELRALVSRAFTATRVGALERAIRALSRELLDRVAPTGHADVIADFAGIVPMTAICWMLGVPKADQDRLRHASDAMLHREEGSPDLTPEGLRGAATLYEYFQALVADRRAHPGDDLVSALIAAEEGGQRLTHDEILGFCFLLVIAGNETTTKLIGNAVHWLDRHPDQRARLRDDPSLMAQAVEEVLRFDTSTQGLARTVTHDTTLHGQRLREGDKVLVLFGSANRDERHWPEPDRFDIDRNPAGHFAFGHGIHFCLGAPLARLEARVALTELLARIPDHTVVAERATRVHSGNVRGFATLPIEFAPA